MSCVVVGLVTYDEELSSLLRYVQSLEIAAANISDPTEVYLVHICNGDDIKLTSDSIQVCKIPSKGNIGYPRACNELWNIAFIDLNADYCIGANPDGAFFYNTIDELLKFASKFPNTLVEARQFPEEHPKIYDPVSFDTPWASGCCLMVPRVVFHEIGLLDHNFFLYMEDVDYSWRTKLSGYAVKICPQALYAHSVVGRAPSRFVQQCFLESGRYLGYKWGCESFTKECEEQLLAGGYYDSNNKLPELSDEFLLPPTQETMEVTQFECQFSFAQTRWGGVEFDGSLNVQ